MLTVITLFDRVLVVYFEVQRCTLYVVLYEVHYYYYFLVLTLMMKLFFEKNEASPHLVAVAFKSYDVKTPSRETWIAILIQ
jgi:hypothetical protein